MIRFLVDECLSPALVPIANAKGYAAFHVMHRGWLSKPDAFLLQHLLSEDLTLVTNNWKDFRPMLERAEVHCGAVVLPNVRAAQQGLFFRFALGAIASFKPPPDMINTVIEVDGTGNLQIYELP